MRSERYEESDHAKVRGKSTLGRRNSQYNMQETEFLISSPKTAPLPVFPQLLFSSIQKPKSWPWFLDFPQPLTSSPLENLIDSAFKTYENLSTSVHLP